MSHGHGGASGGKQGSGGARPPRPRSALQVIGTFLPYLWPQDRFDLRLRVIAALGCLALAKAFNVSVPFFYKTAVDDLSGRGAVGALVIVPLAMILAYGIARVAAQAFGELRDSIFARVTQHAIRTLALSTFGHLHRMSLRFHLDRRTGGLSRVIERGTKGIQFVLQFSLFNIGPTFLEIILVSVILFHVFGWEFTLATLLTIAAYIAFTLVFTQWRTRFRREMNERDTEANTKAIDSLLNYETVKYFGNEAHEANRFDASLRRYEEAAVRSTQTLSMLNVGQGAIIACGLVTVMWLAANGVQAGRLTIGDFVMVNTYLIQLYIPLNLLGMAFREIQQGLVDMESMFDLLRIEEEVRDPPNAPALAPALAGKSGEVRFENVSFAYDPRRPILHGIDFTVAPGRMVAIVGASGAGKSTISRILFRFYDVSAGRVLIDGQDISQVTQASVRAAIAIVPQDTVLFNDSIRYNIRYGRIDASDEDVEEAARLASIDGFIRNLPDGYRTNVGERGLKLSGGEKQRVAIARALLKRPRIMLFDEATSALDSRTEQEIQQSLREVSARFTTIVIAHRLSTVVDADEILVLDKGRIAERGRHVDLLAKGGLYRDMWDRQAATAEIEARLAASRSADLAAGGK